MTAKNGFMIFQRCSDVVESRVEHAILDTESRRNAAFSSVSGTARRANFQGTPRPSDGHSPRRTGPLYRPVGRLVNRISADANASHDFVRMKPVAIRLFALISGAVPICIDQIRCQPCLRSITSGLLSIG